jgi:hypothetical protein
VKFEQKWPGTTVVLLDEILVRQLNTWSSMRKLAACARVTLRYSRVVYMAKRPTFRRPADDFKPGVIGTWPVDKPGPESVAAEVFYRPSGEHKNYPSPTGSWTLSTTKSDKAKCAKIAQAGWPAVQEALRSAIRCSCVSRDFRGKFPSRAWAFINDVLHEARLTNEWSGEYHGFPLQYEEQQPKDPGDRLRNAPHVTIAID